MADIIDGIKIKLGAKVYDVPPLNFKSLRQLKAEIKMLTTISGAPNDEQMSAMVKMVHSALTRNYPELTVDEIEDVLDMGNAASVIKAIMGGAGMVPRQAGEV